MSDFSTNYILYKRQVRFKISPKLLRKIKTRIEEIWRQTQPDNCNLRIRKKGETALINATYDGEESDIIQIAMSNEFRIYNELISLGLFKGDIIKLISFSTFHEIGHNKHKERNMIKSERTKLRRIAINLAIKGDLEESQKFVNLVWDKTYEYEKWAWDFAEQYVEEEDKEDFKNLVNYCLNSHKKFSFDIINSFIKNNNSTIAS